jgi:hypothetical protein
MQLDIEVLECQGEIVSFEPLFQGNEFELCSRLHSLGAAAWNAHEPITVLHMQRGGV